MVFSNVLPLLVPFASPPSDNLTTMPILTMTFLLHANTDTFTVIAVMSVSFNKLLQNAVLHKVIRC